MRVLLVTKPLTAPWNDAGKTVPRALALALPAGIEPRVLTARGDPSPWPEPVRAHALYPTPGGYATGAAERLRLLHGVWSLRGDADLLHFFFQPHPLASRTARWLARLCRRPAVHTVLSAPAPHHDARRVLFADRTVTLSRATAARLAAGGVTRPDVIPPALPETAPVSDDRRARALAAAGLEPGFHLYPGDYEFSGGHRLLLEVWSRARELPRLVLAGRDKTRGAAAGRAAIEREIAERGLADRVRLLGTAPDLAALIAAAGAVLFPAQSLYAKADLPLVVLEAWRESRPVLVSDLAPLAEAVEGLTAPLPADPAAWLAAIRGLGAAGAALGAAGRRRFLERHAAPVAAEAYARIYREVLDRTRGSQAA